MARQPVFIRFIRATSWLSFSNMAMIVGVGDETGLALALAGVASVAPGAGGAERLPGWEEVVQTDERLDFAAVVVAAAADPVYVWPTQRFPLMTWLTTLGPMMDDGPAVPWTPAETLSSGNAAGLVMMHTLVLTTDAWTLVTWSSNVFSEVKNNLHMLHGCGIDSEQKRTRGDLVPLGHWW